MIIDKIKAIFGKKSGKVIEFIKETIIIREETCSANRKINLKRLRPDLPYEAVDLFWAAKIYYPHDIPKEELRKMRQDARDDCWRELHHQEKDLYMSLGVNIPTMWENIQEARVIANEEEALRQAELEADNLLKYDEELKSEIISEEPMGYLKKTGLLQEVNFDGTPVKKDNSKGD